MTIAKILASSALVVLAGGCAITPHSALTEACDFEPTRIVIDIPPLELPEDAGVRLAPGAPPAANPFTNLLMDLHRSAPLAPADAVFAPSPGQEGRSPSMLIISGGGENGAYGAGYLDGWSRLRSAQAGEEIGLPDFIAVTGVSTGALLATHAFLDDTPTLIKNYTLQDEGDVLDAFVPGSAPTWRKALVALRRGAMSDLAPLRMLLRREITQTTLLDVAAEADRGRGLFVASVNVDSGDPVVFNLTQLARKFRETGDMKFRDCYVEMLLASSVVPAAALPVFIDEEMYIDGGARFGVFFESMDALYTASSDDSAAQAESGGAGGAPDGAAQDETVESELPRAYLYTIFNSTLTVNPTDMGRTKWSITSLAARSVSILVNQVYRFSAWAILQRKGQVTADKTHVYQPLVAGIGPNMQHWEHTLDGRTMTCPGWREFDTENSDPLEFHPYYMRCLMNYGGGVAETKGWALLEGKAPFFDSIRSVDE